MGDDPRQELSNRIRGRVERAGLSVSSEDAGRLADYLTLLARWNRKINLTALAVEPASDEAIDRLVVEGVEAAGLLAGLMRSIDLGSGGGSPAIPIRLMNPEMELVMVESRARKCAFLREVARTLKLRDVTVEQARFEELTGRPGFGGSADAVSIRAVRADQSVWALAAKLLRPGGMVLWFHAGKSPAVQAVSATQAGLEFTATHKTASGTSLSVFLKSG